MSLIKNIITNNIGALLVTIIIAVGIACIFRKSCVNDECITYVSPPPMDGKSFKWKNNCYKYSKETVSCPSNQRVIV